MVRYFINIIKNIKYLIYNHYIANSSITFLNIYCNIKNRFSQLNIYIYIFPKEIISGDDGEVIGSQNKMVR